MKMTAVDIRDVKPSRVLLDFSVTIDGGSIGTSEELSRVVMAIQRAFETTAHANGLGYSWGASLHCTTPKRMDARVAKGKYEIVLPPVLAEDFKHAQGADR